MTTNKLADVVLTGWIDALNEAVDEKVVSEAAADTLFDRSQYHCISVAETQGLKEEMIAFVESIAEDDPVAEKEAA